MLSLVLGVSEPMFVTGPGRGGGISSGSEASVEGTACALFCHLPWALQPTLGPVGRACGQSPRGVPIFCGAGLGGTALHSV